MDQQRATHGASALLNCPTAAHIFESTLPLNTKTLSPHSFRSVWVACRVGNVWPECEMASTTVFFSDMVREL